jgi:hypothetical protein
MLHLLHLRIIQLWHSATRPSYKVSQVQTTQSWRSTSSGDQVVLASSAQELIPYTFPVRNITKLVWVPKTTDSALPEMYNTLI